MQEILIGTKNFEFHLFVYLVLFTNFKILLLCLKFKKNQLKNLLKII